MENSFENMIEKEIANYQKEAYGRRECAPRCHAYLGAWGAIVSALLTLVVSIPCSMTSFISIIVQSHGIGH